MLWAGGWAKEGRVDETHVIISGGCMRGSLGAGGSQLWVAAESGHSGVMPAKASVSPVKSRKNSPRAASTPQSAAAVKPATDAQKEAGADLPDSAVSEPSSTTTVSGSVDRDIAPGGRLAFG